MNKIKNDFAEQFDELQSKIIRGAERLGFDLLENGCVERLLTISNGAKDFDGTPNEAWESASWSERIFSIAFRCSCDGIKETDVGALLQSLCLGNWAIGFIDGLPGEEPAAGLCVSCLIKQHSSAIGKVGAAKRHAANTELREWTIAKYQAGTWKSANQAAHALKDSVIDHGRTIGAYLSNENAQRTIAEWIRKSV